MTPTDRKVSNIVMLATWSLQKHILSPPYVTNIDVADKITLNDQVWFNLKCNDLGDSLFELGRVPFAVGEI